MVHGRSQRTMEAGCRQVLTRLPFPIRELHPDNGSEFFNAHLLRFFGETITWLRLSRSRSFHKNDNRSVEQKNATLVRQYFGFARLESPDQSQANALSEDLWTYYNLSQPVMHLADKRFIDGRVRRHWDTARTPYQRLLTSGVLDDTDAASVETRYRETNPRALRRQIYQQLDQLWRSVSPPAGGHRCGCLTPRYGKEEGHRSVTFSGEGTVYPHPHSVTLTFELTGRSSFPKT